MPLTLNAPSAATGNLAGPGIPWQVTLGVAVAHNHVVDVLIQTTIGAGSVALLESSVTLNHATSIVVNGWFGWGTDEDAVNVGFADFQHTPFEGQALVLIVTHFNAVGGVLETGSFAGFTFNSVVGLWETIKQFRLELTNPAFGSLGAFVSQTLQNSP